MNSKRYIPINDDRFFIGGLDSLIMQSIPTYEEEEYRVLYPEIQRRLFNTFSINMQEAIVEFITTVSPLLHVDIKDVIDLACFYYNDMDSVVSIVDEFVDEKTTNDILNELILAHYDVQAANQLLEAQIAMLTDALRPFIDLITGVLSRAGVPAIFNYGSCYRLFNIDDSYNVYFTIRNPDSVYEELFGSDFDKKKSFISF